MVIAVVASMANSEEISGTSCSAPAPWIALGRFPNLPKVCVPVWTAWGWPAEQTLQPALELNA